ncbi:MAG: alpha-(1-_3)-arabinofuranosyltransferase family protein, partial [Solirubrobacteraceae bacterium]|nr:alpha-(1->3)-arabinofuranosyltransferase family protein [Solirubrobacteraceae bacterium]
GMAKLAAALRIGGPSGWVIGGLAYALSPFFVGLLGFTSAAVLPAAVMPWTVLPLVRASQGGSVRRAAGLSGLAILCMGGINATSAITVLVVPAIYIVTRAPGRRRRALMLWWPIAVLLASFWWLAALFFQARYGLDVTAFTETAGVTESTTAAAEVMRGTGNWLGYLNLGDPWVRASWALVAEPVAIIGTAVVAATGLLGLSARGMHERWFAVGTFAFGVVAIGIGYTGAAGGFFGPQFIDLLGGPLAPFRNIYKFEPLVAASLALGVAHAVPAASVWVSRRGVVRRKATAPRPTGPGPWRVVAWAVPAVVMVGIVASALPFLRNEGNTDGAFKATPAYWSQASTWLGQNAPDDTTLLLPASAFAEYTWGRPLDEPMQALQESPWIARTLQPLGGAGSTRILDAIETRIVSQRDSPGLRDLLRRSGVRYLLVRNDLDWRRTGSPRPYKVRQALLKARIPRVKGFGPPLSALGVSSALMADLGVSRDESTMQAVEIYDTSEVAAVSQSGIAGYDDDAVRGLDTIEAGETREPIGAVSTFAVDGEQIISGGPESTVQAADWGLTRTRANILAADLPAADGAVAPKLATTATP